MLAFVVVVVDLLTFPLVFVVVLVVVVLLLLPPPFDGLVFVAGDMFAAGDVFVIGDLFAFALVAVLVFASPGQAAPNKPNVKTAERAITFFISIIFSCLLQRMYVYLFV